VIVFAKLLERWERENSGFWVLIILLFLTVSLLDEGQFQKIQNSRENNVSSVLAITSGGSGSKGRSGSFVLKTGLGKRKKFNIVFHRRLEKYFPDWEKRIDYQKKQEKFYKSSQKKRRELKKLRIKERPNVYTKEELDAISYFQGTGIYIRYQDPKTKPNIFDTRQTYLLKMHDPVLRNNFLNSLNSFNSKTH
jgi:hypothetical protein